MTRIKVLLALVFAALAFHATAQDEVDWNRVERAAEKNISPGYYSSLVSASWGEWDEDPLIICDEQFDGRKTPFLVDPSNGKKEPLVKDIPGFIRQYAKITGDTSLSEDDFHLYGISMRSGDRSRFFWQRRGTRMVYDRRRGRLTLDKSEEPEASGNHDDRFFSSASTADSLYTMLGDRYNLHIRDNVTGKVKQITDSGKEYASFCYRSRVDSVKEGNAAGFWLGHIYLDLIYDDSEVGELYIIDALAEPRPELITKKMPLPNEEGVRRFRLWWYDADKDEGRFLDIDRFRDQNVALNYDRTEQTLWFTRRSRSVDTVQLCKVNVPTGEVKTVISEVCKPHLSVNLFNYRLLEHGKRIIWWSERTGRGNYYLYDGEGNMLNRITQGEGLVAGAIEHIDTAGGFMIFAGYGEEEGLNPYYRSYYRVNLDGTGQECLTHGNGTHELSFSPDYRYAIDRYSRMDMPPVANVVDIADPDKYFELYRNTADSLEAAGWHAPELVTVKAADGVTDLYGLMYTPSFMKHGEKYPIISNVYPGPQDDQIPQAFTIDDAGNQSLAEMGFVVINVAPRGSSPYRGRDFLAYGYGNLRDYPLADDRAAIIQLAERHSFIDTSRVGIYGHSGGGFMTVAAMLTYPDFYKVGVAASGNHDNNIYIQWWGETWHGLSKIPTNMEIADRLKGSLLLISGDMDNNVPYASTLRMADALIKEGKRFDMMIMPGMDHGLDGPYYQNLIRYYFLEHLVSPQKIDIDIINHK